MEKFKEAGLSAVNQPCVLDAQRMEKQLNITRNLHRAFTTSYTSCSIVELVEAMWRKDEKPNRL